MRERSEWEVCLLLLYALPGEERLEPKLFRRLSGAVQAFGPENLEPNSELGEEHLLHLGCDQQEARAILQRLEQRETLNAYLNGLDKAGISVITRVSPEYPRRLRRILGQLAPLVLFCAGNLRLFEKPCISVVGSRRLRAPGAAFAQNAGRAIAAQRFCLCSGGAAGADTLAFQGARALDGSAVLYLADSLSAHLKDDQYREALKGGRLLLVSEDGPDCGFTTPRAFSRNRLIHAMGEKVLVAQSDCGHGGTWQGTEENLRNRWSPVFICAQERDDPGTAGLIARGAEPIEPEALQNLRQLSPAQTRLYL